jgi:hypothetical protein
VPHEGFAGLQDALTSFAAACCGWAHEERVARGARALGEARP